MATEVLPPDAFELDPRAVDASHYHRIKPGRRNCLTWSVTFDGRVVPFKYLRQNPTQARPTILFFHGMGIQIHSFRGIAPYLYPTHDLILVDYTSFSQPTHWPAGGVSLRLLTLAGLQTALAVGVEKVSLIGSSLGGGMCLISAIERPAMVEKIVLLNAAAYPQDLPLMYRLMRTPLVGEALAGIVPPAVLVGGVAHVGYSTADKMPEELFQAYQQVMTPRANRFRLMDLMRHLPANAREVNAYSVRAREIRQPVLVVWGSQERLILPDTGPRMARELPNATLLQYDDLAHLPHEEAPERVGPAVAKFLNA